MREDITQVTLNVKEVSDIFADIHKQTWEFEQKYHVKPKFIKMGYFTQEYLRRYVSETWTNYFRNESLLTYMGLCICPTPAIKDFTIEVF